MTQLTHLTHLTYFFSKEAYKHTDPARESDIRSWDGEVLGQLDLLDVEKQLFNVREIEACESGFAALRASKRKEVLGDDG